MSAFESASLPVLFGLRPFESQYAAADTNGDLVNWVDAGTLGSTVYVGFAGNVSAFLFVSRPPQDWTSVQTQLGIPPTASIRLVTEPDTGLTVMVFAYVDNAKMSISQRVCLMYGFAQGDPRAGLPIRAVA
jgi:hypothetical protein